MGGKRGKSPGTQVQHTLAIGTIGTELRHFLTFTYGTMWAITKSARTFAPLTTFSPNTLINNEPTPAKTANPERRVNKPTVLHALAVVLPWAVACLSGLDGRALFKPAHLFLLLALAP